MASETTAFFFAHSVPPVFETKRCLCPYILSTFPFSSSWFVGTVSESHFSVTMTTVPSDISMGAYQNIVAPGFALLDKLPKEQPHASNGVDTHGQYVAHKQIKLMRAQMASMRSHPRQHMSGSELPSRAKPNNNSAHEASNFLQDFSSFLATEHESDFRHRSRRSKQNFGRRQSDFSLSSVDSKRDEEKRIYSGRVDSGRVDSGRVDSGRVDSGLSHSGRVDSGRADSGRVDSGRADSGRVDSGRADSGRVGSGRSRSGRVDSGRVFSVNGDCVASGRVNDGPVSGELPRADFDRRSNASSRRSREGEEKRRGSRASQWSQASRGSTGGKPPGSFSSRQGWGRGEADDTSFKRENEAIRNARAALLADQQELARRQNEFERQVFREKAARQDMRSRVDALHATYPNEKSKNYDPEKADAILQQMEYWRLHSDIEGKEKISECKAFITGGAHIL